MGFWTALRFLTVFPVPQLWRKGKEDFSRALPYFPLVGLILGIILSIVYYGCSRILPVSVTSVLLILILAVVTGANHLDGLMDSFDGIVVGKSKERRLEIMADSRVGAFGILAAVLLILLQYAALVSLPGAIIYPALILMVVLSRWIMVSAITIFPYARNSGLGLEFKRGATWKKFAIATFLSIVISVALSGWWGLLLMVLVWTITFGIARYFNARLGGLTGDVYGVLNEISEVLVIIILLIFWML